MKSIRKKLVYKMYNNDRLVKALSLAIFVKNQIVSSTINNYTIDKLHILTSLHSTTIKKRLDTLKQMGLVKFVGKNKEHMIFESITSSSEHRNVYAEFVMFDNIKDIEKALYALLVVEIQKAKDFVKHTIQSMNNPSNLDEHKKAKKICNRNGYGNEYKEYGISYKYIAKRIGVCLQKAFNVVKFAIEKGFLNKFNRQKQEFSYRIGCTSKYDENKDYTFCTLNNKYTILANVYSIGSVCYPIG